jgi:hypothetical protein
MPSIYNEKSLVVGSLFQKANDSSSPDSLNKSADLRANGLLAKDYRLETRIGIRIDDQHLLSAKLFDSLMRIANAIPMPLSEGALYSFIVPFDDALTAYFSLTGVDMSKVDVEEVYRGLFYDKNLSGWVMYFDIYVRDRN